MATNIGVRSLTRRGVRIGTTLVGRDTSVVVDVDDPKVRRDLQKHMTLGALIVTHAEDVTQLGG